KTAEFAYRSAAGHGGEIHLIAWIVDHSRPSWSSLLGAGAPDEEYYSLKGSERIVYNESFIPIILRNLYKPSGGLRSWLRGVRTVVHSGSPVVCVCLHLPVPSTHSQAIRRRQLRGCPRQWRRASLRSSKR